MRRMLPLTDFAQFLVLFLFLITVTVAVTGQEPATKSADFMAGTWILRPAQEGPQEEGPGPITLLLTLENGRLAGTAVIPIQGGEKRWPLVDPTFDGETFSFKVDNGEMLLEGEMRLVGESFEGNWKAAGGENGGRLTMTRKVV
jgi:hypothetical protein